MAAAWHVGLLGRSCRGENVPRSLTTRSEMHRRPHMLVDDDFAGRHGLPVLGKRGVSRGQCLLVPSRPGEFHPEPLTDPDLNLSIHTARVIARRLPPSAEPSGSSRYDPVGPSSTAMTCPLCSTGITPLRHYYEAVRPSPAHQYFRPRGWRRLCLFPWHRRPGSHVPYKSQIELRAVYMPDAAWAVSGIPQADPGGRVSPRF